MKFNIAYIVFLITISYSSLWAQVNEQQTITVPTSGGSYGPAEEAQEGETYTDLGQAPILKEGSLQKYFQEHYIINKTIKKEGKPGTLTIAFVIERDSTITNIQLLNGGLSPAQNDEAIRV